MEPFRRNSGDVIFLKNCDFNNLKVKTDMGKSFVFIGKRRRDAHMEHTDEY